MDKDMIFTYIKAEPFFRDYLPHIKNFKRKISSRNSKGSKIDFTDSEKKEIIVAVQQFAKDIKK